MKASAIVLWLLAPFCLWLTLYRPVPSEGKRAVLLPRTLGAFTQSQEHPITPRQHELLGTPDAAWRTYRDTAQKEVYLVAVFHEHNWKSVHPPRICIEGSNMAILGDDTAFAPDLPSTGAQSATVAGRIVARSKEDGREYVSLAVYGTRDFATGSYLSFFLHHAPAALFRRNTSGYLLRVESFVEGEPRSAAENRCWAMLQALLPAAQQLVR